MPRRYKTLADYFEQTGTAQAALAARLDITPAYVSMLTSGVRQPSLRLALEISRVTGVPPEALLAEAVA